MTYDHWKATNPDDEFLGPRPVDEPTELEMVHESLSNLIEAVCACDLTVEEDASYDDGAWRNLSQYRLTFSLSAFHALLDALGIEVKHGQTSDEAFEAVQEVLRSKGAEPPNASAPIPLFPADDAEETVAGSLTHGA